MNKRCHQLHMFQGSSLFTPTAAWDTIYWYFMSIWEAVSMASFHYQRMMVFP